MQKQLANTSPRYRPLSQLVLARLREFYREPEAVFWVYGFPILMVVALGIAFRNKPIEKIRLDVVAPDRAAAERISALLDKGEPGKTYLPTICDFETARLHLRSGKSDLIVRVVSRADREVSKTELPPRLEYFFDPSRPESMLARNSVDNLLQRAAGRSDPIAKVDRELDEPGGRYIDFLVPGMLGMSLMGGGLWGVGYVTVDMRIRKLLKRFLATPMKKSHFLAGIMISRLLFMVPEVLVLLVFAWLAFGVKIYGSVFVVILLILLGAGMFAGIGLLVASRAKTLETVSGLMNLVMLPMWVLSGIFFSPDAFPISPNR